MPVSIDEETLQRIAEVTGGRYFRATDTASLEAIYAEIDELEKTPHEGTASTGTTTSCTPGLHCRRFSSCSERRFWLKPG